MLTGICYVFAFALLVFAALLPPTVPHRDRMAFAGLALWLLPTLVHVLQAR